jgi:hypothetical protein
VPGTCVQRHFPSVRLRESRQESIIIVLNKKKQVGGGQRFIVMEKEASKNKFRIVNNGYLTEYTVIRLWALFYNDNTNKFYLVEIFQIPIFLMSS